MKILIFTEGTILMAKNAAGHTREEVVRQVEEKEPSVREYGTYIPVDNAAEKIKKWAEAGAEICYLTSRRTEKETGEIRDVLARHNFPAGELFYRKEGEEYKDVAERVMPDVLIEDDCESIGGLPEMTHPHIRPEIKAKIKSVPVVEFGGIDHLPDEAGKLLCFSNSRE